jgi:hypothetical protein
MKEANQRVSVFRQWRFLCLMPIADWLGLALTPDQQAMWERERAGGRKTFVLKRGSVVGFYCVVVFWVEYAVNVSQRWGNPGELLLLSLFLLFTGYAWALFTWRVLSTRFDLAS